MIQAYYSCPLWKFWTKVGICKVEISTLDFTPRNSTISIYFLECFFGWSCPRSFPGDVVFTSISFKILSQMKQTSLALQLDRFFPWVALIIIPFTGVSCKSSFCGTVAEIMSLILPGIMQRNDRSKRRIQDGYELIVVNFWSEISLFKVVRTKYFWYDFRKNKLIQKMWYSVVVFGYTVWFFGRNYV